jgi:hypothetical protein
MRVAERLAYASAALPRYGIGLFIRHHTPAINRWAIVECPSGTDSREPSRNAVEEPKPLLQREPGERGAADVARTN